MDRIRHNNTNAISDKYEQKTSSEDKINEMGGYCKILILFPETYSFFKKI